MFALQDVKRNSEKNSSDEGCFHSMAAFHFPVRCNRTFSDAWRQISLSKNTPVNQITSTAAFVCAMLIEIVAAILRRCCCFGPIQDHVNTAEH